MSAGAFDTVCFAYRARCRRRVAAEESNAIRPAD